MNQTMLQMPMDLFNWRHSQIRSVEQISTNLRSASITRHFLIHFLEIRKNNFFSDNETFVSGEMNQYTPNWIHTTSSRFSSTQNEKFNPYQESYS